MLTDQSARAKIDLSYATGKSHDEAARQMIASNLGSVAAAFVLFGLILVVLNFVAVSKIITKAGYSGGWVLLVLAPFVAYLIGYVALYHTISSGNFEACSYVGWFVLGGLLFFVQYIFFLVFAFSDWPVRRQLRNERQRAGMVTSTRFSDTGPAYPPVTGPAGPPSAHGSPGPPPLDWQASRAAPPSVDSAAERFAHPAPPAQQQDTSPSWPSAPVGFFVSPDLTGVVPRVDLVSDPADSSGELPSSSQDVSALAECPNCGLDIHLGNKFCRGCGSVVPSTV